MMLESFVTFTKAKEKSQSYYVYNDCQAIDEKGKVHKDFADIYILMTNLGWSCKASDVSVPKKEARVIALPLPRETRKGEFVREFRNYLFCDDNMTNLEMS